MGGYTAGRQVNVWPWIAVLLGVIWGYGVVGDFDDADEYEVEAMLEEMATRRVHAWEVWGVRLALEETKSGNSGCAGLHGPGGRGSMAGPERPAAYR